MSYHSESVLNTQDHNLVSLDEKLDIAMEGWVGESTRVTGAYKHPQRGKIPVMVEIIDNKKITEGMAHEHRKECELLKELDHPHIAKLHHVIYTDDQDYMAFESCP